MVISFLILTCSLLGLVHIVRSIRGRPVPCEPVCARCGYDLRGFAQLVRCSECGSDLRASKAVRRATQRTSRRGVVGGLALIAAPWAFLGLVRGLEYLGPHFERVRSNASLVADIDDGGGVHVGPYPWSELARRVASGRMSREEAAAAMDPLLAYAAREEHSIHGGGLVWARSFYEAADRAGAIDAAHHLAIAQLVYGRTPRVELYGDTMKADAAKQYWVNTEYPGGGDLPGAHLMISVAQAYLTGASATPEDLAAHARDAAAAGLPRGSVSILGPQVGMLLAPRVHSGSYTATFVVDMMVLPGAGQTRWVAGPPPPGATPLAQWRATVQVPVVIYPGQTTQPAGQPDLLVRTDDAADPMTKRSLSVISADEYCYRDRTRITLHLKVDHVPVPCWFTVVIRAGGQRGSHATTPVWSNEENEFHYVGAELPPIDPDVRTADVELVPDLDAARKGRIEQVWGKVISFKDVPLTRHDMGFDLAGWRAKHPATQESPAARSRDGSRSD